MQLLPRLFAALLLTLFASLAQAQANLQINTPSIETLKKSMRERHAQIKPFLENGAIGLTREGGVALRDANAVPLPQRAAANSLVAAENADRTSLYKEIAVANGKPEWEGEIRSTFSQRWIERAQPGWYVQNAQGAWVKK
ncbi:MAG TPA: YdbL family protein [Burkholderiales bacterium]|jgi:hypothetical protein|nr:YdbL family protein [Burkholderiales bacterium]